MDEMVTVRYTGPRLMPMRVQIYVNGNRYNGQGYRFGQLADSARMTRAEADVLTGLTEELIVSETGAIVNGLTFQATLTPEERAAETWELVEV